MNVFPKFELFESIYAKGHSTLVWFKGVSDLETPVSIMAKLEKYSPNSYLLESVINGVGSRYSFIGLKPDLVWKCHGNQAKINRKFLKSTQDFENCPLAPLDSLRKIVEECHLTYDEESFPQTSVLTGYLSWETAKLLEPSLPMNNPDELDIPDGIFIRPTISLIFDNITDSLFIATAAWYDENIHAKMAYEQACNRIKEIFEKLSQESGQKKILSLKDTPPIEPQSNMTKTAFKNMVAQAKEYIKAGDAFQIVPSQRFHAAFPYSSLSLYRSLRHINPSPYMFYLNFQNFQIVGASPETMVKCYKNKVTIRPLAGTRKRGKNESEDNALMQDLLKDPKELAEHLMLLDLGRNDVGRVSKVGSVKPTTAFAVEKYSHVMHIVSNVEGVLDDTQYDAIDALFAGLPAGTVSGAPKIRAMEIIDELEPVARKFYAGTIAYFNGRGDMDSAIALRSALIKDNQLYAQSGVGVVYDSEAEAEYEESLNKAMSIFKAAAQAKQYEEKD